MCGIVGVFNLNGQEVDEHLLYKMAESILHRGPDDQGFYKKQNIGLGHLRLSILDLSSAGHQPMQSGSGRYWITYNGEIYNYIELRQELESLGYNFKTKTDTEVILNAYECFGKECLSKFNGMWAFAIWDSKENTLFCSRDRFGIKPFYYFLNQDYFIFASEIKALLEHPIVPKIVNPNMISEFLIYSKQEHTQQTFFKDIFQLMPAHNLLVTPEKSILNKYWSIQPHIEMIDLQTSSSKFLQLFQNSLNLQLRSDVPIGSCLSGGLDSSAIVCAQTHLNGFQANHYQTFSACYQDTKFDERIFIEKVLSQTGVQSNFVFPSPDDFLKDISLLIRHHDEPFLSLSAFAQWSVMKTAAFKGIKVLLDGQGADELMAGYGYHGIFWSDLKQNHQFSVLWKEIQHSWGQIYFKSALARMFFPNQIHDLKQLLELKHKSTLYETELIDLPSQSTLSNLFQGSELKNTLYDLFQERLISLLRMEDRNSMAFSIESRVPFLDLHLVEFIFSLPSEYLIHKGWSKWILRQAMQGVLPEEIRWRSDKMGFVTPQDIWLTRDLKEWVWDILNSSRFMNRSYWKAKHIQNSYQDWLSGRQTRIKEDIWRILHLELWLQSYFE